jgi:hypothetical protein
MSEPRYKISDAVVTLPDGRILIAGGYDATNADGVALIAMLLQLCGGLLNEPLSVDRNLSSLVSMILRDPPARAPTISSQPPTTRKGHQLRHCLTPFGVAVFGAAKCAWTSRP